MALKANTSRGAEAPSTVPIPQSRGWHSLPETPPVPPGATPGRWGESRRDRRLPGPVSPPPTVLCGSKSRPPPGPRPARSRPCGRSPTLGREPAYPAPHVPAGRPRPTSPATQPRALRRPLRPARSLTRPRPRVRPCPPARAPRGSPRPPWLRVSPRAPRPPSVSSTSRAHPRVPPPHVSPAPPRVPVSHVSPRPPRVSPRVPPAPRAGGTVGSPRTGSGGAARPRAEGGGPGGAGWGPGAAGAALAEARRGAGAQAERSGRRGAEDAGAARDEQVAAAAGVDGRLG